MAYISTTDRSHAVVEARPRNESIVIKIGDALIVLEQAEALQLSADLAAVAGQADPDGISGGVSAIADIERDAVVITIAGKPALHLASSAWATLAMQGSNAALALQGKARRTGLRAAVLHRSNADLVEVQA